MIDRLIIIKLNNVHKDEQKTLKKYLESNCWDWKEINKLCRLYKKENEND